MKKFIALIVSFILCLTIGYQIGIKHATTAEGWIENSSFLLDVDGQIYEWIIDDCGEQPKTRKENKMKYVEIIKMPKGYYVKKVYGANIQMQFVKTKKEAEAISKAWRA